MRGWLRVRGLMFAFGLSAFISLVSRLSSNACRFSFKQMKMKKKESLFMYFLY